MHRSGCPEAPARDNDDHDDGHDDNHDDNADNLILSLLGSSSSHPSTPASRLWRPPSPPRVTIKVRSVNTLPAATAGYSPLLPLFAAHRDLLTTN